MNVIKFDTPSSILKRATAHRSRQEEFASVGVASAGASGIKMKFPKRDFRLENIAITRKTMTHDIIIGRQLRPKAIKSNLIITVKMLQYPHYILYSFDIRVFFS